MKFLYSRFSFVLLVSVLLSACSPHKGTGVWKATTDNEWGIERLVVGFEGKAEFTSVKKDNAVWHCFWSTSANSAAVDEKGLSLDCTASTNTDKKEEFFVMVNDQGQAELRHDSVLLATFTLLDENPSPRK